MFYRKYKVSSQHIFQGARYSTYAHSIQFAGDYIMRAFLQLSPVRTALGLDNKSCVHLKVWSRDTAQIELKLLPLLGLHNTLDCVIVADSEWLHLNISSLCTA